MSISACQPTPVLFRMPTEAGLIPIKSIAFATMLVAFGTTSAHGAAVSHARLDGGSTGLTVVARQQDVDPSVSEALAEIRRRAGLTWGQIASLFDVSRRTVHAWANGSTVRPDSKSNVLALLDRIRAMGGAPAFKVRDSILGGRTLAPAEEVRAQREPPILVGDLSPFSHQVEVRARTTRIKRG